MAIHDTDFLWLEHAQVHVFRTSFNLSWLAIPILLAAGWYRWPWKALPNSDVPNSNVPNSSVIVANHQEPKSESDEPGSLAQLQLDRLRLERDTKQFIEAVADQLEMSIGDTESLRAFRNATTTTELVDELPRWLHERGYGAPSNVMLGLEKLSQQWESITQRTAAL